MPQSEWPTVKREKTGDFVTPDGYLRSGRNVSGPLRMGTAPGTGPSGLVAGGGASDFEMDRVTPRGFDPIGSHNERAPKQESSPLLSRAIRGRGSEKPNGSRNS
jgi:hypothetical protein